MKQLNNISTLNNHKMYDNKEKINIKNDLDDIEILYNAAKNNKNKKVTFKLPEDNINKFENDKYITVSSNKQHLIGFEELKQNNE